MLPQTSAQQLTEVLFTFFSWISVFLGLVAVLVFAMLGVGVFTMKKEPPRFLLLVVGLAMLRVHQPFAMASYVHTILSEVSPYDSYVSGGLNALSSDVRERLRIFQCKRNYITCHIGPNLTDKRFHNTGVAWHDGKLNDPGRFAVTGKDQDRGAFKPPTLREVTRTAPYMHHGSLKTLEDVVDYYDRGGNPKPYLDSDLPPLHLAPAEEKALISFLGSLNGRSDHF